MNLGSCLRVSWWSWDQFHEGTPTHEPLVCRVVIFRYENNMRLKAVLSSAILSLRYTPLANKTALQKGCCASFQLASVRTRLS